VGLGRETARVLASRGATVILACRDVAKGEAAADSIAVGSGVERDRLRVIRLDLASLASVSTAADEIRASYPRLDLLINNAGVMAIPFVRSEDGFELTFATNHLGHFALTGLLLERLLATPGSRVVTVSSVAHRRGHADFDALESEQGYKPGPAYDRSKLANLLFAYELQRRLDAAGTETISVAAHPGIARTDLWRTSSRLEKALLSPRMRPLTFWLAQSAQEGSLPTLRAALDPDARGGDYYGPTGFGEYTGRPGRVDSNASSHDRSAQRRLWQVSERLSGVSYPLPDGASSLSRVGADDTVVLTVVSTEPEAEVVCGLLRSAGIECGHRDTDAIDSSVEDFIAAGPQEILVRESDLEAAKELLAASQE
jgi:NAD(P)-dependent dehydrogenase (short-subunit alcohol dehydrogenase family)